MTGELGDVRVGVIADTHDEIVRWDDVQPRVAAAFGPVDLIVHCGDLTTVEVLDRLSQLAPVVAVRSEGDPPPDGARLSDGPRVIDHDGLSIGIVNTLPADATVDALFGVAVDVVTHGGTHEAAIHRDARTLFVNPGSPSLADAVSVAVVERVDGVVRAEIVRL